MIPFNPRLYFKILPVCLLLTVLIFVVAIMGFEYELTNADPPCSAVAAILVTYIVHLMLWRPDQQN